ncbi:amino acid ABC transporter ATP-binding protein [Actinomadura sp. K4S16]|uniref:amino acid ABC transporter ATP-binding protein n=1 Tax=Actinomadura sp. K4S16 TaxID=1316147 RepID=UPI0011EDF932|nr:amino acid ABC transporter ATP-binding protein [Actinomadura sp. K4S16]
MEQPMVRADNVHKSYGATPVLNGVSLTVERGETVCVMGPSGSGKSTFLRCIHNLETIDAGRIYLDGDLVGYRNTRGRLQQLGGRETCRQRSQIGMVFQHFNLFPHMTVLENVTAAQIRVKGVKPADAEATGRKLLADVGLAGKAGSYPRQLSGGQQQRVAIARALAMDPKVMLFDEPTSALDPELVGEVLAVIRDLARTGMTMIVVTHETGFAREAGDSLVFMDEGRVIEVGPARDVIAAPRHERTRGFLSTIL